MTAGDNVPQGTVLIVDDNATNLAVLFEYLKKSDFKVLAAESGKAALELLQDVMPDIILLDILMPDMDGFETCRRLKVSPRLKHIPVIFMTALTETVDKVKGFGLGAVDYITKPIQHQEVLARVNTHLTLERLKKNLIRKNEELEAVNQNLENMIKEKTDRLIDQEKTAIMGRLFQGIVHNLKTPLGVIKNSNIVIQKRLHRILNDHSLDCLDTQNIELLNTICSDSDLVMKAHTQIMDIVNNLMLKSRMDQKVEKTSININNLLKQEFDFLNAHHQFKHKTEKELILDNSIAEIPLIYSNIAQTVENLINNALDAMWNSDTKKLKVVSRQDEKNIYIDIIDSGSGIPDEKINSIFDPFFTTKPPRGEEKTGEPTGTGLGLHSCLELLKPFNGTIKVKSKVGEGSSFTIVLPK